MVATVLPGLERRLKAELQGEVLFDRFSRGRYATDASHYQIMPVGVVLPRTVADAVRAIALAREEGISVLPRGGGTSQSGQTVNESLVVDCSKYLDHIIELDVANRRCVVEPGIVLDELNRRLKPHGLWFPVDISTASRATIGGMVGNNSCGARSLRYGNTRENVLSIDALLADGSDAHFGPVARDLSNVPAASPLRPLAQRMLDLAAAEADEIEARFPKVQRRVGGYNLDALVPGRNDLNLAHILVGSEGTLAFSTGIELKLAPLLGARAVGACHFGSFHQAMDMAQHIVKLGPIAVELVDRTMLGLARDIAMFQPTVNAVVRGDPEAILFVEFAEPDAAENVRRLRRLGELIGDHGFSWQNTGARWGGVIEVLDPKLQAAVTDMRTAGLNIMMSMKDAAKPISFVEDCAVPLEHLADYTSRLTAIFEKHGTHGTWYAHASVGCLHVRPVLNLRLDKDVAAMRAIAEEAFAMVRAYKGSHSGEHGDGIVRSEFHPAMFGERLAAAFGQVKDSFDPRGLYNPGKIVRAPKFDDRKLLRYGPRYQAIDLPTQLDWSAYPGLGGGFQGAVEMCNNNGACRSTGSGVMCPSYRATRQERDVTRGRANSLRLAMTGQLGPGAFASDEMAETMRLCVSCKACRRECPTGVDMARMKIEVQAARAAARGLSLHDRLVAYLPRYAPFASRWPSLLNLRNDIPLAARLSERLTGFAARRKLPRWRRDAFRDSRVQGAAPRQRNGDFGREVVLFADTFNRYFEPENVEAALKVLTAAGYRVHLPEPLAGTRPLCCGRTFLSAGLVDEARVEAERTLAALAPFVDRGMDVVGLEPSCVFGFRDEIPALLPREPVRTRAGRLADHVLTFEEFVARAVTRGGFDPPRRPVATRALLHGHCHQKSFGTMPAVEATLRLVPGLAVDTVESSCCGMAGAFGYGADTIDVSLQMAELSLLPTVRAAPADALVVASGTSCRHQIKDGSGREPLHVARVLAMSVAPPS
ncbi:MAG TPA: FAD-linked oxidase C-terminal domain-containing protein [Xanthobacteraceae bacterium]|nr:FAD-linked oxidase C-terminal domain-containing protein [Xanthobacteraceae bacterium]